MARILTLGETMGVAATASGQPLRTTAALRLSTAGAESTVAIGLRRLGHHSVWVGVVGDDELGERVRRDLRAEDVDVRFIRTTATAPTGFMIREVRTAEYTQVSYYRQGSAGSQLSAADVEAAFTALESVDVLHISGITAALSEQCAGAVSRAVSLARSCGAVVSFDVNYRRTMPGADRAAETVRTLLPAVDVLFAADDELTLLSDSADPVAAARHLVSAGHSEVIVKRGAHGSLVATADGELAETGALPVAVVDTVGAGDSFVAGYLAARAEGRPLYTRLQWGTICAACTVGTYGDWEGLPLRGELGQRAGGAVTLR